MDKLRATSRKHTQQKVLIGLSLAVLVLGLLPIVVLQRLALGYLAMIGGLLVLGWMKEGKKLLTTLLSFHWVYLVEVELLRSDFVWAEISSDLQKGRRMVELPAVRIEKAEKFVRVVAVRNSLKFQERLLKADLSAVFNGWVMSDVNLNEDKSEVFFTLTRQGAELGYHFDSLKQMKDFAKAHGGGRLPLDLLSDMKTAGHTLLVGQTGSGKTLALVYLLVYYLSNGWSVAIADPKNSDLALLGRSMGLRVETTPDGIISLVTSAYEEMNARKARLEGRQKFGKTASEQGESNVMVIIDEYASLTLAMDKKQVAELSARVGNLVLEGRQLSVHVTLCMQQANAQVVPTQIREQLVNKLVMGSSDEQTYVTAFGQSSASEVLAMAVKAGQGWLMTEGKLKPVFVRLPWLSSRFMDSIDSYIDRKQKEGQTVHSESGGLLIVEDKGQLMP